MRALGQASIAIAICACLAGAAWFLFGGGDAAEGDPRRGRILFQRGFDAEGAAMIGRIGAEAVPMSAHAAACATCHGHAGTGEKEGGVEAPDISAAGLAAWSDGEIRMALAEGSRPDGRRLGPVMPRYALSERDLRDLLAYVRTLGIALDPGVGESSIRVGMLLPEHGGTEARAVLEAYFAELNARGGVHRRRIELTTAQLGEARTLLGGDVFALVGSALPRADAARAQLEREGIPVVGPLGDAAREEAPHVFGLYPAEELLARVAVQSMLRSRPPFRPIVIYEDGELGRAWLQGARSEAARRGQDDLPAHVFSSGPAAALEAIRAAGADAVIYAGGLEGLLALEAARAETGLDVQLHAPAVLASGPAESRTRFERVSFWSPALLTGTPSAGVASYYDFLARSGLQPSREPAQHQAYAAARLLVEALRRVGAKPTRAGFVEALEGLQKFDTGVTPPVTYGRYRRTGITGAYLGRIDPKELVLVRASEWYELAPP